MITLLLVVILAVGSFLAGMKLMKMDNENVGMPEAMLSFIVAGFTTTTLLILIGCAFGYYQESLELEGLRQKALTAKQAIEKHKKYSQEILEAKGSGSLLGSLDVKKKNPKIRHTLEANAVKIISQYNETLGELKGKYRGRLWLPSWGISTTMLKMKPIEIPDML